MWRGVIYTAQLLIDITDIETVNVVFLDGNGIIMKQ